MIMKCKICELEYVPPRRSISNCNKCIVKKKLKTNLKTSLKKHHQKANKIMMKMKVMNKMRLKKNIEHKQLNKNQLSNGDD